MYEFQLLTFQKEAEYTKVAHKTFLCLWIAQDKWLTGRHMWDMTRQETETKQKIFITFMRNYPLWQPAANIVKLVLGFFSSSCDKIQQEPESISRIRVNLISETPHTSYRKTTIRVVSPGNFPNDVRKTNSRVWLHQNRDGYPAVNNKLNYAAVCT